jgi:hypothetical protein
VQHESTAHDPWPTSGTRHALRRLGRHIHRHNSHRCLSSFRSYTVEITVPFAARSLLPREVEVGEQPVRIGIWSKSPHGLEPPQLAQLPRLPATSFPLTRCRRTQQGSSSPSPLTILTNSFNHPPRRFHHPAAAVRVSPSSCSSCSHRLGEPWPPSITAETLLPTTESCRPLTHYVRQS